MESIILFAAAMDIWYAFPLVIAFSLVYSATRHEHIKQILPRAARVAIWTTAFMAIAFGLLQWISVNL